MSAMPLPEFKSSPVRAIRDVFATDNWVGNVLWLSLAGLASSIMVGYIALLGYGSEVIERRAGRPEYPPVDIDSERIGDYISKGIWPFLVALVAQAVLSAVMVLPLGIFGLMMAAGSAAENGAVVFMGVSLAVPMVLLGTIGLNLLMAPLLIRAMVCRDFKLAFDLEWIIGFVKRMWAEMLVSGLLFGILSAGIMVGGYLVFCVGYIPAIGIVFGGSINLLSQWYEIYLSRGGEPAPPAPDSVVDAQLVG